MYLEFFGLKSDPFKLDPNLDFVYVSKSHEETMAHLVYGIEQGEDFVLITGGIGTGKTLALHYLLDQIVSSYRTAFVNVTKVSFHELLKLIIDDLEINYEMDWDRADLLSALKKYLHEVRRQRAKVLVVVDEAQNLSIDTLEGLRLLSNLSQPGSQVLQIILVGQPGLQQLIATDDLEQLQQRIRVHYQLEEMSSREVQEYIHHRMKVSGSEEQVFSLGALGKVYELSHGVPRLVNQYAGKALLSAFVEDSKIVKASHVEEWESTAVEEEVEEAVEEEIETPVEKEPEPRSILKNPAPKRQVPPDVEPAPAPDVDFDKLPDPPPSSMATFRDRDPRNQRSGNWKILVWAACAVLVLGGGFYLGGGWDWITGAASSPAQPQDTTHQLVENSAASTDAAVQEMENLENLAAGTVEDETPADPVAEVVQESSAPVQAAAVLPEAPPEIAPTPKVLHVASFRNTEQANTLLTRLKDQGVEGFIKVQGVNGATWYRVYLGPFPDEATANRVGQELKDQKAVMYYRLLEMDLAGS